MLARDDTLPPPRRRPRTRPTIPKAVGVGALTAYFKPTKWAARDAAPIELPIDTIAAISDILLAQ